MNSRLRISGRVQGVGYRAALAQKASELGLRGWVRNRTDGSVEAVIVGTTETTQQLITWAQVGPPLAQVAQVTVEELEAGAGTPEDFRVLPTC